MLTGLNERQFRIYAGMPEAEKLNSQTESRVCVETSKPVEQIVQPISFASVFSWKAATLFKRIPPLPSSAVSRIIGLCCVNDDCNLFAMQFFTPKVDLPQELAELLMHKIS